MRDLTIKGSLFTRSICFSGLYQAHDWSSCDSWRPKRARHVCGRWVKCLGLIAGVSFARLIPFLCSLCMSNQDCMAWYLIAGYYAKNGRLIPAAKRGREIKQQ